MFCPNCGKQMPDNIKFCTSCGASLDAVKQAVQQLQPTPQVQQPQQRPPQQAPQPQQAVPVQPQPQAQKPPKKRGKLPLFIGIAIAAVILLVVVIGLASGGGKGVNVFSENNVNMNIPGGYDYMGNTEVGVSFLYPTTATVRDNGKEGIYVYPTGNAGVPYIQVESLNRKVKPSSYFKSYDKQLKKEYSSAQIEDIKQVNAGGKTLYMQRATVFNDGSDQTVDRYIEIYKNKTIEYTVKTVQPGAVDNVLNGIVQSLCPKAGIYGDVTVTGQSSVPSGTGTGSENPGSATLPSDAFPGGTTIPGDTTPGGTTQPGGAGNGGTASCAEVNISMDMPQGMQWQDISVGVTGMSNDLLLFAVYEDSSYQEAAFYGAQDILLQANSNVEVLKQQLFLDAVQLNNMSQATLGGLSGFMGDVSLTYSGFTGSGKMYFLTPADTIGVYIVYYAVSSQAADAQTVQAQGEAAVASFKTTGAPSEYTYSLCGKQDGSFQFVVDTELVNAASPIEKGCTVNVNLEDSAQHTITVQKNNYSANGITTLDQFMQYYAQSIGLSASSVRDYEGGRYNFKYILETYNSNGITKAIYAVACADSRGNIYTIYAEDEEENMDDYDVVIYDIVWSFYINEGVN